MTETSSKKDPIEESRTMGRQAMLNMAKDYEKSPAMIQHAIETYKEVIAAALDSKEANEARKSLLRIAQKFEKEGKKESAFHIYQKLAREFPRQAPRHPLKY